MPVPSHGTIETNVAAAASDHHESSMLWELVGIEEGPPSGRGSRTAGGRGSRGRERAQWTREEREHESGSEVEGLRNSLGAVTTSAARATAKAIAAAAATSLGALSATSSARLDHPSC